MQLEKIAEDGKDVNCRGGAVYLLCKILFFASGRNAECSSIILLNYMKPQTI